jgi:uncharacterized protein (TIGR03000 family)
MIRQRLSVLGLSAVAVTGLLLVPKQAAARPFVFVGVPLFRPVTTNYGFGYPGGWGGWGGYGGGGRSYWGGPASSWGWWSGSYFPPMAYTYTWSFYPASFTGSPVNNPYRYGRYYTARRGGRQATLEIRVPTSNAELWVEGVKQAKKGKVRKFKTPVLSSGKYTYRIRVRWKKGKRLLTRTRNVVFKAGERVKVNFLKGKKPSTKGVQPKKKKKKAVADGEGTKPDKKKKKKTPEEDVE